MHDEPSHTCNGNYILLLPIGLVSPYSYEHPIRFTTAVCSVRIGTLLVTSVATSKCVMFSSPPGHHNQERA